LNVGHLCGHGHDERVIKEVPVVRVFLTRKNEAAGPLVVTLAKELACIVQGEDRCMKVQDNRIVPMPRTTWYGSRACPISATTAARLARAAVVVSTRSAIAPSSSMAALCRILAIDACAMYE
jgi:hypothetical protein